MRHCENEFVNVYEVVGDNLADLLRDAADQVERNNETNGDSWHMLTVGSGIDGESTYLVTLYAH